MASASSSAKIWFNLLVTFARVSRHCGGTLRVGTIASVTPSARFRLMASMGAGRQKINKVGGPAARAAMLGVSMPRVTQ